MDQEMDSAVKRQKSQPRTGRGSLIHYFTKLWAITLGVARFSHSKAWLTFA
jgi:hypothetical protein